MKQSKFLFILYSIISISIFAILMTACETSVPTINSKPTSTIDTPIEEPQSEETPNEEDEPAEEDPDTSTEADFNKENAIEDIEILSSDEYEGRETGTEGAIKSKNYIISRFEQLEVQPLTENFIQAFSFYGNKRGENILGVIHGSEHSDKYIVLSAHYDHLGIRNGNIFNGADDNASGVAGLLACAEFLKKNQPKHTIILAALDAEEKGLKGAYHFVDSNIIPVNNIVLNLNFDMISRSDAKELYAVGSRYTSELKPIIQSIDKVGVVNLKIGHEGLDNEQDWTYSSDHAAFYKKDIPFIYFGVEDHSDYHKHTDEFSRIDQEFTVDAIQTIINALKKFDATL